MSRVELRDAVRLSPERARSLFTVRAAISSARPVEAPRSLALSLMCSYWRARFVAFLTPRGGIQKPLSTFFVASIVAGKARNARRYHGRGRGGVSEVALGAALEIAYPPKLV